MKDDEAAEKLYRQARNLSSALGTDPQGIAWHHYHLGAVYLFRGALDDARDEFEKALRFFDNLNDNLGQVATLTHLGEIACGQRKIKTALEYLKRGVELILSGKSNPLLVDMLAAVAQLLQAQGEDKKAISLLMVALSNPTCRQQTKDRMVSIANELETSFTPGEVDKGFRWAKGADLEEMAQSWLNSLKTTAVVKAPAKKIKPAIARTKKSAKSSVKAKRKK
jgi:tetratricopeptide (TPR) repeat protein